MPRIEFQISTPVLLDAILRIVESHLYSQCFVSVIPGLYLDHIETGKAGPFTQSSHAAPASELKLALSAKLFIATGQAVKAAGGGPPTMSLNPDGVPLSANFLVAISGTKLSAKFDAIVHDDSYNSLKQLVATVVGAAETDQLLTRWENTLKQALASLSAPVFDLRSVLPPQVKNVQIARSALCADSEIFAVRFEVGGEGSDGNWDDFKSGNPGNLIGRNKWSLFISGDVLANIINDLIQQLVSQDIPRIPVGIDSEFLLLAGSGPLSYSPLQPIAPATASVKTTATIRFSVVIKVLGIEVGSDQGDVELIASLLFTISDPGPEDTQRFLSTSLYYSVTTANAPGGLLGTFGYFAGITINIHLPAGVFPGFSATDIPDYFVSQTPLPPVVIEKVLTLTVSGCTGTVEPPISETIQKELKALSTGVLNGQALPIGGAISPPGAGLLIYGNAIVAPAKSLPDCGVSSIPFALVWQETLSGDIADDVYLPPVPANVPAKGSFSVYRTGSHASERYPLIIGAVIPFNDPTAQWYHHPSLLPKTPHKPGNFVVTIPEAKFRPAYMANPYPLSLIVCTNGGARFASLGPIPVPVIDSATGHVDNAKIVVTYVPGNYTPPSGPQHPVTINKAP